MADQKILAVLREHAASRPILVVMEGLLYYLSRQAIDRYFQERLGRSPHDYIFLDEEYFRSRPGFQFVEEVDYPTVESRYASEQLLTPQSYLDERMYILERLPHGE
jgi:O-methyltransferase involved in polyketide biosynthesis